MKRGSKVWIVDGIWGNHRRWSALARKLEKSGAAAEIWRYENSGFTGLETVGARLAQQILQDADSPIHLVGYSMGGLVVREAARLCPPGKIGRVALLNSPHRGSLFAAVFPLRAARDMIPGSPFLRRLDAAPWSFPTLAVWCPWDLMVFPGNSANWPMATKNLRSDVPAHVWPVFSAHIHREVTRFLLEDG